MTACVISSTRRGQGLPLPETLRVTVRRSRSSDPACGCAHRAVSGFRRWLTSPEVVCSDTRSTLTFGPGLWNVFARSVDSVSATATLVDGDAPPQALSFALVPAATTTALLPPQTTGVVYAPRIGIAF